jgi:hypothetical protein
MKPIISKTPGPLLMSFVLVAVCLVMLFYAIISIIGIMRPIILDAFTTGFERMLYTIP